MTISSHTATSHQGEQLVSEMEEQESIIEAPHPSWIWQC